jgi:DNA-binding response OmpR family regulator
VKWSLVYFDDQIQNIECFKDILSDEFEVYGSHDPGNLNKILMECHPHAFLLDVHMPLMDGFSLYRKIIDHPLYNGCPIFFISGDHSDENKIRSFENGGIDFLTRDLGIEELVLRISNKIKFYLQMSTRLELGNLSMNMEQMKVTIDHSAVELTLLEMRMLSTMLRAFPEVITRTGLIKQIWGDEMIKPTTINTHITNMRPKIEAWSYAIKLKGDEIYLQEKD